MTGIKSYIAVVALVFLSSFIAHPSSSFAIETTAKQAYLVDMTTHSVLLDKEGAVPMHPSSMSKLMTTYVLFSRLKEGRIALDSKFMVSEKAWRTQGSKTFVNIGGEISVEDLIHGIVIQSGNDACVVVAEGISGTEEAFAELLNQTAKDIGLTDSHFVNASGLPEETHLMSPRDLARLAERLIVDFPEYYHYFAMPEYTYNNIRQYNRNLLLKGNIGVDGLKTGHTEAAGYGITLSAKQGERRLILVVNGLTSEKERAEEGEKLLRWGFREFENKTLAKAGQKIDAAEVWFGASKTVPLVSEKDVVVTLPINSSKSMSYKLRYIGPIPAPITKGTPIAELIVTAGSHEQVISLVAGEDVAKLSGINYMLAKAKYQIFGRQ